MTQTQQKFSPSGYGVSASGRYGSKTFLCSQLSTSGECFPSSVAPLMAIHHMEEEKEEFAVIF